MIQNMLITTMPIKPQKNPNIGMCFAPLIVDILGEKMGIKKIMSVNLLHSYDNKDSELIVYLEVLKSLGISYDELFVDKYNKNILVKSIESLYNDGYLVEKTGEVYMCLCGKLDIAVDGVRGYDNGDLYYVKGDKVYCKKCGSLGKKKEQNNLYLYLSPKINDYVNIVPSYLQADFSYFYNNVPRRYILISKNRKTGFEYKIGNNLYNIDIDLLWMNYVQCFEEKKQILIASNHQLYEMYIVNYISKMLSDKELYFIATPYMNKTSINVEDKLNQYEDLLYKKLVLLYTLKWKNKNCNWDDGIFKGIAKLGRLNRKKLYQTILGLESTKLGIDSYIDDILVNKINYQKNLSLVKEKNRDV